MKRFNKGYVYSSLLSDLFSSLVLIFVVFKEFFIGEDANTEDIIGILPIVAIVFAVVYLCFIVYRILYYKTSGYELTQTEIKCNRGVFVRKRSILECKKIHAVNKKQNLIQRIFGVAVLTVDSGSTNTSNQAEITIIESEKNVDELLTKLSAVKDNAVSGLVNEQKEEILLSEDDSLYRFTSKKKMVYTLINIVSTAFFTVLFGVLAIIVLSVCKLMLQQNFLGTWGEYLLYATLITLGAILLFSAFSFIGCMINSFIGYYNFRISKRGNDIQISFGLLEKHTNTFSYDRIKAVKISQGLVQRMLGFAAIKLEVIGYTNDTGNDNNSDLGVLVPFCKYDEVGEILSKVLPDYIPDKKQTNSVSYFPFVSWFMLTLGIVTCVLLVQSIAVMAVLNVSSTIITEESWAICGVAFVVLIIKLVSAALSYNNNGLAVNRDKITVYNGGFTKNVIVFMSKNLIATENITTPLRKKAGITSLVMHLKTNALSNEVKVHIQNDAITEEIEKLLIM